MEAKTKRIARTKIQRELNRWLGRNRDYSLIGDFPNLHEKISYRGVMEFSHKENLGFKRARLLKIRTHNIVDSTIDKIDNLPLAVQERIEQMLRKPNKTNNDYRKALHYLQHNVKYKHMPKDKQEFWASIITLSLIGSDDMISFYADEPINPHTVDIRIKP